MRLTVDNLVRAIHALPRDVRYHYPNPTTRTRFQIVEVTLPVGPIRYNRIAENGSIKQETISSQMLQRYVNAFIGEGIPVNIDRVLGASYNNRSVLEAMAGLTPEFFTCRPQRFEATASTILKKKGHKHLLWSTEIPHAQGRYVERECNLTISETPSIETIYGVVDIPETAVQEIDIEVKRRHTQIQIALAKIGHHLGYRTYIAINDQSIEYNNQPISQLPGVVTRLNSEQLLVGHQAAAELAKYIDCVWFKNGRLMPAVMEVEHSTGVSSGLLRMNTFRNAFPPFPTRWVIVASDEDRNTVIEKASNSQFHDMNVKYFPYSAVEELYGLCERRKIRGVTEEFLDCFMENVRPSLN